MHKLILFDFDGTLADTAPDLASATNKLRAERGLDPLPYSALRPMASHGARGLLKAGLDLNTDDVDYPLYRDQFLRLYEQEMLIQSELFPGMRALLDTLKRHGYAWGIVTNKTEHLTHPLVRHLGLDNECVVTVGGDTTPYPKPHPAPLLHAAKQAGVETSACIYIGDDERDIVAGKAAGMPTIAAAWGYCVPDDVSRWQADGIAQTPDDVWPLIEKIASIAPASQPD